MTWKELRLVAKKARTDWRTVRRFLQGQPMRITTMARVKAALKRYSQMKGNPS